MGKIIEGTRVGHAHIRVAIFVAGALSCLQNSDIWQSSHDLVSPGSQLPLLLQLVTTEQISRSTEQFTQFSAEFAAVVLPQTGS